MKRILDEPIKVGHICLSQSLRAELRTDSLEEKLKADIEFWRFISCTPAQHPPPFNVKEFQSYKKIPSGRVPKGLSKFESSSVLKFGLKLNSDRRLEMRPSCPVG